MCYSASLNVMYLFVDSVCLQSLWYVRLRLFCMCVCVTGVVRPGNEGGELRSKLVTLIVILFLPEVALSISDVLERLEYELK